MKVILLKDVPDVGDKDEVVEVSQGHANNFIIPQGLGVVATPEALRARDERRAAAARAAEIELATMQKLAERIDGVHVTIAAKVSESGTLYAAVTLEIITAALARERYTIEPAWIMLPDPLKKEGEYDVQLNLPHGLEAMIQVTVTGSE